MPDPVLRASVRRMVEFSLRGGDLTPVSAAAMQEGSRAHRSRQKAAGAAAERAVSWEGTCGGVQAGIQGRIDLLWEDRSPVCVDELKLISGDGPLPDAPVPAHRMQAVCYGFMLCEEMDLRAVSVRVSYVTAQGAVRVFFEETLSRGEAREAFYGMLRPLAEWFKAQTAYQKRRDLSLAALAFPFPSFRAGQREMAAQVYTAIDRRKRLYATLPTGTGKSAASLFPALKALGNGKTEQIFYLTARGTAQLSALDTLARLRTQELALRSVVITAKEKCCPQSPMQCHPDFCPRAKGYYDRELPAILEACRMDSWSAEDIASLCERHMLCPFEFSLALCEISDVVICDYNYVFDPIVSLKRIIGQGRPVTLLMDEAHNMPGRVRSMLSARLDSRELSALRRDVGKLHGRKSALYKALSALLSALKEADEASPDSLLAPTEALIGAMAARMAERQPEGYQDCFRALLQFRMALERRAKLPDAYGVLSESTVKERSLELLSLDISSYLRECTGRMRGCVFFSATLSPLEQMKTLLGGDGEDAVFALPSPFPPERLLVLSQAVDTRYQRRADSAESVALSILAMLDGKAGSYIAYFSSYAYMLMVRDRLLTLRGDLPLNVQARGMDEAAREAFLSRIRSSASALLSLCVLGGIFSEGIDLPGKQLIGVAVVGVGLPQVNAEQEALKAYYETSMRDGFAFAYRYPGMQKVLQAAGRVIRSEQDAGVVLLLDSRYRESAYRRLLPPHYRIVYAADSDEIRRRTQDFWQTYGI